MPASRAEQSVIEHHTRKTTCRLCNGTDLELVLPMAPTPVADDYVTADRRGLVQTAYPLDLHQCLSCGHVQLLDVVDPEVLFRDYIYTTSVSLGLADHFRRFVAKLLEEGAVPSDGLVVEIGSNDGTVLRCFKDAGRRVVGIDPASKIAEAATAAGIQTRSSYFTSAVARDLKQEHGHASVIIANNVFAHIDDLGDVADGIRTLLAPDGIFVFEVSYLVDIVDKRLFDTVYHEHLCYHSITSLIRFFSEHGLQLIDVERIPTKGGSIRGTVQLKDGPRQQQPIVAELAAMEARNGFDRPVAIKSLSEELQSTKQTLLRQIDEMRRQGLVVAGYGASATVTTLLHYFDLGHRLAFLLDDNPVKHHRFSPGHHIEVFPSSELYVRKPDCVVVLAWAYADVIVAKHRSYVEAGGRFLVPMPWPRLIEATATP